MRSASLRSVAFFRPSRARRCASLPRLRPAILLLAAMAMLPGRPAAATFAAYFGGLSARENWDPGFAWSVHAFHPVDRMVFVGAAIGQESVPGRDHVGVTSSLFVRLPFGTQLMPVLRGEMGAGLREYFPESFFLWKIAGGADLKLGERSSLLAEVGLAAHDATFGRMGLLLDF